MGLSAETKMGLMMVLISIQGPLFSGFSAPFWLPLLLVFSPPFHIQAKADSNKKKV